MDVLAALERPEQPLVARQMGEDAQLDLAVVRREQDPALGRDEHLPDALAYGGADRDVLQVRIGGREPSGRRHGLAELAVNAARLGVNEWGQRVDVRAL